MREIVLETLHNDEKVDEQIVNIKETDKIILNFTKTTSSETIGRMTHSFKKFLASDDKIFAKPDWIEIQILRL